MISMDMAYSWLNIGDRSHLSAANLLSMMQIEDRTLPPKHREAVIHTLRYASELSGNTLEALEIKVTLGKLCYKRQEFPAAKSDLVEAVKGYKAASHRLGVSKWMLGILLWEIQDQESAYLQWSMAKEIFIGLAQAAVRNNDTKLANWYIEKKDEMILDISSTAEEAFYWLNFFGKSSLSDAGNLLAVEIRKKIQKKEFPLAYEIGLHLARISKNRMDTNETADAWVVLGLAALQMGNPRSAVDYFLRGSAAFGPRGHRQAVTRWMMGIAQWLIPEEIYQAINNWNLAIEVFEELKIKAEHENNQLKFDWYRNTIIIMQNVLKNKISSTKTG